MNNLQPLTNYDMKQAVVDNRGMFTRYAQYWISTLYNVLSNLIIDGGTP
jgi:hypothetical protein